MHFRQKVKFWQYSLSSKSVIGFRYHLHNNKSCLNNGAVLFKTRGYYGKCKGLFWTIWGEIWTIYGVILTICGVILTL